MANGSCLCGEVTYTFGGVPVIQAICHCAPCHKISGSTYTTNLLIPTPSFNITTGSSKLKTFSFPHPSGMILTIYFCEKCGTKIYKEGTAEAFKGIVIVQAGTLDGRSGHEIVEGNEKMGLNDVVIGAELWVKERASWVPARGKAAQMEEFS